MTSFNLVQTLATSKLWSKSVCTSFTLFLNQCLPCVQSSLRLPELCVGDNQSISFTKVNKHLTSVILPRPCGPTIFLYDPTPATLFQSSIMMVFVLPFPSSSRISSIMSYSSSTSSSSCSDVGMYTCIIKIFIGSACNLIAMFYRPVNSYGRFDKS